MSICMIPGVETSNLDIELNRKIMKAKAFFSGNEVGSLEMTLEACLNANHMPLYIPQIIDAKLNAKFDDGNLWPWMSFFTSPSIRTTGKTKKGNIVVAYVHTENYFSNPKNIRKVKDEDFDLIGGALVMPKDKFHRIIEQDEKIDEYGNRLVWVFDYNNLKKETTLTNVWGAKFRQFIIKPEPYLDGQSELKDYPEMIALFGGEKRTTEYIERMRNKLKYDYMKKEKFGCIKTLSDVCMYNNTKILIGNQEDKYTVEALEAGKHLARPIFLDYDCICGCNAGRYNGAYKGASSKIIGIPKN